MSASFGEDFLRAIEKRAAENNSQDIIFCTILEEIVRSALGLAKKPVTTAPSLLVTSDVRPEFPQFRVKYSKEGVELARRRVNSLEELGRLVREDYTWVSATPIPAEKGYL